MLRKKYVLDTNVLIHDPTALYNFDEHHIIIPMTVLEELDTLKSSRQPIAAECRRAIRLIDQLIGDADDQHIYHGVPIPQANPAYEGRLSILSEHHLTHVTPPSQELPKELNDNKIINLMLLIRQDSDSDVILITKDINMRLKARACAVSAEDYQTDQLVSDVELLWQGYTHTPESFWQDVPQCDSRQQDGRTLHVIPRDQLGDVYPNQFIYDDQGFAARILKVDETEITLLDRHQDTLLHRQAWGLQPRNIYQAMALDLLMDPEVNLVLLTGSAGSGKTILTLAAALELTVEQQCYRRIIVTRSTPPLAEDIGFLPGTEQEKMDPWLAAIHDNLEALHENDEDVEASIEYIKQKVPIQFKSLNYIRGRSIQKSLLIIDECQNLTPQQMKAAITRAGQGTKVICLGNLAQIDAPYLSPTSSGLTYAVERFKPFLEGGALQLNGVPRSALAEFAELHL